MELDLIIDIVLLIALIGTIIVGFLNIRLINKSIKRNEEFIKKINNLNK